MNNITDKEKWDLIDEAFKGFNELPIEKRKRVIRWTTATQLQTFIQMKMKHSNDMSPNLKRKLTESENYIAKCLEEYIKEEGKDE